MPGFRVEGFVLGLFLLGLGVIWTLANLGQLELLPTLRTWWPMTLVLWGAAELAQSLASNKRPR